MIILVPKYLCAACAPKKEKKPYKLVLHTKFKSPNSVKIFSLPALEMMCCFHQSLIADLPSDSYFFSFALDFVSGLYIKHNRENFLNLKLLLRKFKHHCGKLSNRVRKKALHDYWFLKMVFLAVIQSFARELFSIADCKWMINISVCYFSFP